MQFMSKSLPNFRGQYDKEDEVPRSHMMDEQTYNAHFESMRKVPGHKPSKNKQLIMVHKDLQKRCDKTIMKHAFDTRHFTAGIKREQQLLEKKQESFKKLQQKYVDEKHRTHYELEYLKQRHVHNRQAFLQDSFNRKNALLDFETNLIQAIEKLTLPKPMKERLAIQGYSKEFENS